MKKVSKGRVERFEAVALMFLAALREQLEAEQTQREECEECEREKRAVES